MTAAPRIPGSDAYRALCERLYRQNEFAVKLGTERMRAALDGEGAPDAGYGVVLVAGTNGKGSVCSLLNAALVGAGVRVGLYTSPHLVEIRERLRVDGTPIAEADFVRLATEALERWGDDVVPLERRLTYFELVTLVAARWFAEQHVDVGLFEIGLGGRLDACNALEPLLSVITRVAYDHEKHLGHTLSRIFDEKAGVLRPRHPAVVCRPDGWTVAATRRAAAEFGPAPLYVEGETFGAEGPLRAGGVEVVEGWLPLAGEHQRPNAACALEALLRLGPVLPAAEGVPVEVWAHWAGRARWPGRWQEAVWDGRPVWLDAAHNPNGAASAAAELARRFDGPVTAVMAALGDKRVELMVAALAPRLARVVATPLGNPRALAPEHLAEHARAEGLATEVAGDVGDALLRAAAHPEPIVVLGSLYLVGDVLHHLGYRAEDLPVLG